MKMQKERINAKSSQAKTGFKEVKTVINLNQTIYEAHKGPQGDKYTTDTEQYETHITYM